jgi:hypothetical protein
VGNCASRRIAIIGPRRRHTGTGPFVSEFFRQSGCAVFEWERDEACHELDRDTARPEVEAVAICSPAETHFDYLAAALAKRLHVFCEKPIVWPRTQSHEAFDDLTARLARVLEAARRDGLTVHENTQWVYTLDAFRRIAGDFAPDEVEQFRCELSPSAATPIEMLLECASHANSLLLGLGCQGVEDPRACFAGGGEGRGAVLSLGFRSRRPSGRPAEVQYHFAQAVTQPRHAAYEVNHRRVQRRVGLNGYRIYLQSGPEEHLIRDPLRVSVEDFLSKLDEAPGATDSLPPILTNIQMSQLLFDACIRLPEPQHA